MAQAIRAAKRPNALRHHHHNCRRLRSGNIPEPVVALPPCSAVPIQPFLAPLCHWLVDCCTFGRGGQSARPSGHLIKQIPRRPDDGGRIDAEMSIQVPTSPHWPKSFTPRQVIGAKLMSEKRQRVGVRQKRRPRGRPGLEGRASQDICRAVHEAPSGLDGPEDQVGGCQAGDIAGHAVLVEAAAASITSGITAPIPTRQTIGRPSHWRSGSRRTARPATALPVSGRRA